MSNKYLEKAKKLNRSGFWLAGYGNFDLSTEEVAIVLELLDKKDYKSLVSLYERLSEERLG